MQNSESLITNGGRYDFETVKVVNVFDRGLSKSRNIAIQNSTKDILVFTDDDVVFELGFEDKILKEFNSHNSFDGFRFKFKTFQYI